MTDTANALSHCHHQVVEKLDLVTLRQFKALLTDYEQQEILKYRDIYYVGSSKIEKIGSSRRRIGSDLHSSTNVTGTHFDSDGMCYNSGFDDSRGDLYLTKHDHVGYRYEILSLLGKGSFGQVVKCFDHLKRANVALKVIRNKRRFVKQGEIELELLTRLAEEDIDSQFNLVHITDSFSFRGHLCFAFELLGLNLYEWLKAGKFKGVHLGIVRIFASQILTCLTLLDTLGIIHCDLKPEVLL